MSEKLVSHETPAVESIEKAVGRGSIVELHYTDDPDNETLKLQLIESIHDSTFGKTLLVSLPLGQALLGKTEGDSVLYTAPDGEEFDIKIVSIEN